MKRFFVLKLIPVIFLSGALLAGCSDEPDCPDKTEVTKDIPDDQLIKVAYNGTETLIFKNEFGDTERYVATGKQNFIETKHEANADPACGLTHTINYLAYRMNFISALNKIEIVHSATLDNGGFYLIIDNSRFDVRLRALSNNLLTTYPYRDSVAINGIYYHKVSVITNLFSDTLLMNSDNGILLLKSAESNTPELSFIQ